MAIYTYSCADCKITIEKTRSILEQETSYECDKCGSILFRVYNSPEVKFNGSGFYSTDK